MANLGDLKVGIKADDGSLRKANKNIRKEFDETGKKINKELSENSKKGFDKAGKEAKGFGGQMKKLGTIIAGVFAFDKIKDFGKKLLGLGSDLQEVQSRFDVVFSEVRTEANATFESIAEATNRSVLDLKKYGGEIGDLLKPMGFAGDEALKLSENITKLGLDMASFANKSDEQAINAITKAFVGEKEALKSLGVTIKQAEIDQKAYNLGLVEQGEELTEVQKGLATYRILLDKTSDAQTDATRTAESYANQLKGLKASIKDTFAEAGKDTAQETTDILSNLTRFIDAYGKAIIESIVDSLSLLLSFLGDVGNGLGQLITVFTNGLNEAENSTSGFGELVLRIGQIIKSFLLTFRYAVRVNAEIIAGLFETIIISGKDTTTALLEMFKLLGTSIKMVFVVMKDNIQIVFDELINVIVIQINKLITQLNKIPKFDMVELEVKDTAKDIKNLNDELASMSDSIAGYATKTKDSLSGVYGTMKDSTKTTLSNIEEDWKDLGHDLAYNNLQTNRNIDKANKDLNKNTLDDYDATLDDLEGMMDKYMGAVKDNAKETSGEIEKQNEKIEDSMDKLKGKYEDFVDKQSDLVEKQKEIKEATKEMEEFSQIKLAELKSNIVKVNEEYQDSIDKINEWKEEQKGLVEESKQEKLATEIVQAKKERVQMGKDLTDLIVKQNDLEEKKQEYLDDDKDEKAKEVQEDINAVELKITKNKEKQKELMSQITEAEQLVNKEVLKRKENYEEASRFQKIILDAQKEMQSIEEETEAKKKEAEKKKEKEEELNKFKIRALQELNKKEEWTAEEVAEFRKSKMFNALSDEQKKFLNDIMNRKLEISQLYKDKKKLAQDLNREKLRLQYRLYEIQKLQNEDLMQDYLDLVKQIDKAISKQKRLNELKFESGGAGFAKGGYTGDGPINQEAGTVHKGEYVIPNNIVEANPNLIGSLEKARNGGSKTVNKSINIDSITSNSNVDLRRFFNRLKRKL